MAEQKHMVRLNERVEKLMLAHAQLMRDAGATDDEIHKALCALLTAKKSSPGVTGLIEEAIAKSDRRIKLGERVPTGAATVDFGSVLATARKGREQRAAIQKRTDEIRKGANRP